MQRPIHYMLTASHSSQPHHHTKFIRQGLCATNYFPPSYEHVITHHSLYIPTHSHNSPITLLLVLQRSPVLLHSTGLRTCQFTQDYNPYSHHATINTTGPCIDQANKLRISTTINIVNA